MSYRLPPLPWLRAFEAAARWTSFTAAAEELQLTPAAVSYQVRSLEQHLGFALFERLPRSLRLTDMGKAYLPSVRKAFDELSASTMGLFGPKGEKAVMVRATISFGVLWLAPRLKDFMALYPDIDVRLCTTVWADALAADETDIDIRYGDGRWRDFEVEFLRNEAAIPVCAPALHGTLDPQSGDLIHIMGCEDVWQRWFATHGPDRYDAVRGARVDNSIAALEMASAGAGHTIVLESFAAPYLAANRLVRSRDKELPVDEAHYLLLSHGKARPRPEVLLFREWLRDAAQSD